MHLRNNKGYSLIELIVGVVILGIISAPLLSMFITSSRTSMVSRNMGDATVTAENILEQIETTTQDNWVTTTGAAGPHYVANSFLTGAEFLVTDSSGSVDKYANIAVPDIENLNEYYQPYQLLLDDYATNKTTFDIRVTLDPGAPEDSTDAANIIPADAYNILNEIEMSKYTPTNNAFNQSFDNNIDVSTWSLFVGYLTGKGYTSTDWDALLESEEVNAQRTITLTVETADTGNVIGYVTYEYEFTHPEDPTDTQEYSSDKIQITTAEGIDITSGEIPTFYLMFYPWYYGDSSTEDIIVINKDGDYKINTVLIKKEPDNATLAREDAYDASVYFIQPYDMDLYDPLAREILINGNLLTNIGEPLIDTATPSVDNITYYIYNGSSTYIHNALDTDDSIVLSEKTKRIYEVTIEVFDSDTYVDGSPLPTNPVPEYTVKGTKLY